MGNQSKAVALLIKAAREEGFRDGRREASRYVIENDFRIFHLGYLWVLNDLGLDQDKLIEVVNGVQKFWQDHAGDELADVTDLVQDRVGIDLMEGLGLKERIVKACKDELEDRKRYKGVQ